MHGRKRKIVFIFFYFRRRFFVSPFLEKTLCSFYKMILNPHNFLPWSSCASWSRSRKGPVQCKGFSFNVKFKVLYPSPHCFTPISSTSQLQTERSRESRGLMPVRYAPTCTRLRWTSQHAQRRTCQVWLRIQVVSHLLQAGIIHVSVLVLLIRWPVLQRVSVMTVSSGFLFTRHSLQVCLLSLKHGSLSK
jgi:hypothetical protein